MNKTNTSFDVIGDLFLETNSSFNWDNKSTSLYCIITGNISNDVTVIKNVLSHLNKMYQGVFYIAGYHEFTDVISMNKKNNELQKICNSLSNVLYLNNYVVILDNIAIIGINNWYNSDVRFEESEKDLYQKVIHKYTTNDSLYIESTVKELQLHVDITEIIIVTSCVPRKELMYGTNEHHIKFDLYEYAKNKDSESKIKHWIFGNLTYDFDVLLENIRYVNNPKLDKNPYWPKRIEIS